MQTFKKSSLFDSHVKRIPTKNGHPVQENTKTQPDKQCPTIPKVTKFITIYITSNWHFTE